LLMLAIHVSLIPLEIALDEEKGTVA
jgi:hypothetical protein